MRARSLSRPSCLRLFASVAFAALCLPSCEVRTLHRLGGESISITTGDDELRVWVSRKDYELAVKCDGAVTFLEDESDVATLGPSATFELEEIVGGVERAYEVRARHSGELLRTYTQDGEEQPFDDEAKRWLAGALPRMFRESGFDAEARIGRLLARGGAGAVLDEIELVRGEHAKVEYVAGLVRTVDLDEAQFGRVVAATQSFDSDYELRRALGAVFEHETIDGARAGQLLGAAKRIESDYELAELLIDAAELAGADPTAAKAWEETATLLDSDYELRRTLEAGLAHDRGDVGSAARRLALAAERIDSDYELGTVLKSVAKRGGAPELATAYVAACRSLDSDYERRNALVALLDAVALDRERVAAVLAATAEMDSDYEKQLVLAATADRAAKDPELERAYREIARSLGDYERGKALTALDDAMQGR
ncbi:MAG: hypothetical protein IT453_07910 [Planctomycetes bacterium]|nr:hypothetical protein [Planctomycetota bacterium]